MFKKLFANKDKKKKDIGGQSAQEQKKADSALQEIDMVKPEVDANRKRLKELIKESPDVIYYNFTTFTGMKAMVVYIEGLIFKEMLDRDIIGKFLTECKSAKVVSEELDADRVKSLIHAADVDDTDNIGEAADKVLDKNVAMFVEGVPTALIIPAPTQDKRSIEEPAAEVVSRGPREGFVEVLSVNRMLIRKIIRNRNLVFEDMKLGRQTSTSISLVYIDGIYNADVLKELKTRLLKIDMGSILDSGYIQGLIKDNPYSPYETVGYTERPDVVAGKILEGRIGILVDGSPVVLTVPYLFLENFQASEDYYNNFLTATLLRTIRFLSFMVTILTPGLYVALTTHHQAMIPTKLLLSFISARQGVPFPVIVEVMGMIWVFSMLKETGVRMPRAIGQTISIVGALVLGQAVVQAKFISAPVVIIVAITGITSFFFYRLNSAVLVSRFMTTILSAFLGLYGLIFSVIILSMYLLSLRSFGIPYMGYIGTLDSQEMRDTLIRAPWWFMDLRPQALARHNIRRRQDQ